ncbi:MAG: hypothetical protein KME27_16040 [Lyngbya sp. HA4199-MV5]|nr:hypothetical protein [Lyngbya sp. HA4199-MV5]
MLSRLSSRLVLIAAATPLTAVMVHSQSLPHLISQVQQPTANGQTDSAPTASDPLSNASVPVCYIQLENGQIRDLRRLCGKKPLTPPPSRSLPRATARPVTDDDDDDPPASASSPQMVPSPRSSTNQSPTNQSPTNQSPTSPSPISPSPTNPSSINPPAPQATPTRPTPQPTAGSLTGVPDRSTTVQPSPTASPSSSPGSPNPSSSPNPLAIPQADDSRD